MSPLNPKQDAEFQALARQLVNLKRKPVSRNIRKIFDPDSHLFDQDVEAEYDEEVFLRDFGALSPDLIWPTFDFWPQDLGSGIADIVPVVGGVAPTFTRATTATTVDRNGLIVSVASGSPRSYYDPSTFVTNLLLQSQNFSTTWAAIGTPVITAAAAVAPDGSLTASTIQDDSAAAYEGVSQAVTVADDTVTRTFSIYVKKTTGGTSTTFGVNIGYTGGTPISSTPRLNTDTGVVISGGGSVTAVGDYWRLSCSLANNGTGNTTLTVSLYPATNSHGLSADAATATGTATVWGAQLERASTAGRYVPTTTAIASSHGTFLGYLAEGARTNLCLQSEDLATTWTNGNTTETVNAVASPDGATTADKLVETAAVGQHYIDQTFVKAGSAIQYSFSVFLKAAERDMIQVLVGNTALTGYSVCATVNLAAGTVGSASAAGSFEAGTTRLTAYPNGWYRFEMNGLTSDTDVGLRVRVYLGDGASFSYAGDITKGAYVWGAQLEAATFASSYIPTTTVAVARNADVLTLPPAGWYSATAGTFFVDAAPLSDSVALTQTAASVYTNTSNYIAVEKFNANVSGNIVDGGVTQAAMAATATTNRTLFKAAMAYASNDGAASVNGGTVGTDAAMSIPATTTAGIGHTAAANHFFGTIRRGTYFNQRLPNYLLQRITANGFDRSVAP